MVVDLLKERKHQMFHEKLLRRYFVIKICKCCGKPFYIRKSKGRVRQLPSLVRGRNCVTCSPKCSKEYNIIRRIISNRKYREAKKEKENV